MNVTVIGAGSWGAALAVGLSANRHQVTLWARSPEQLRRMKEDRRNAYLPGIRLPSDWLLESDFDRALDGAEAIVLAVPTHGFRQVARRIGRFDGPLISVTKGIDHATGHTMSGILKAEVTDARPVALSGPTFALEVARGLPSAIVAGSDDPAAAAFTQRLFHRPTFRVYTSSDRLGVEMGGALKNVVAIASGVCDGLGFGDNSKAALVTRGIVEITRLGVAHGAKSETFAGLSGLGDLVATCFSRHSRNRRFGELLGKGLSAPEALEQIKTTVEGYPTARSAHDMARQCQLTTPIIDEVYNMLYHQKDIKRAVEDLLNRESKPEVESLQF